MIKNVIIGTLALLLIAFAGFVFADGNGEAESPDLSERELRQTYLEFVRTDSPNWFKNATDQQLFSLGFESCTLMDQLKSDGNYSADELVGGIVESAPSTDVAEMMVKVATVSSETLCREHSGLMTGGLK